MNREIRTKLRSMLMEIGYHGSAQPITRFTSEGIGKGGDANSSLGLFTSQILSSAADYAEMAVARGEGIKDHVYVLAIPTKKIFKMDDLNDFYGLSDDFRTHEDFSRLRLSLMESGFEAIEVETGDDVIMVSINPDSTVILAELSADQAFEIEENIPEMDGEKIYEWLYDHGLLLSQKKLDMPELFPQKESADIISVERNTYHEPLFGEMSY